VTVLGKETDAEAVVADLGSNGSATAGRFGDDIADEVVVLAVYYRTRRAAVEQYGTPSRARWSSTSRIP
jgi:hypothetical protein